MQTKSISMRRVSSAALLVLLLIAVGMTKGYAYDFSAVCETGQTLYYNITDADNHYVELTCPGTIGYYGWSGYTKPTDSIVLPSNVQYNGINYSVTSIGNYAFYGCSGLTGNLTIPNSVTTIGNYAFYSCSGFTGGLSISNSVTTIGYNSFNGCNFNGLDINMTIIPVGAFNGCSGFTGNLTIGNSVSTIGINAFRNCSGFSGSLTIGNSVTTIEGSAFYGCSGFTGSLTLPNSVSTIGTSAFSYCSGFTGNLTIPDAVTLIDYGVFSNCSGFNGNLTISDSVTTIEGSAFYGCSGFTSSLTIGALVTSIGSSAFRNCSGFTEVYYNAVNCANADSSWPPFEDCGGELIIGYNVESIPANIFKNGGFTGSVTIPNAVTSIGNSAFSGCSGFTEVIFNATNCIGGNSTFIGCDGTLIIGDNVESISGNMFRNCGFSEVYFNAIDCANANISYPPFQGCGGVLTIGANVERMPDYMFRNSSFTTVNFNAINCADGNGYFSSCSGILTIGDNVQRIPAYIFQQCSGFTSSLIIPNSVTSIGNAAFNGCSGLTGNLTIPNSVSSIGSSAFQNCCGFTGVIFNATNCADYNYYSNPPFQGCSGTLTIGANVERIPAYMFKGCSGFTGSLTIPNSVTSIGNYAFYSCSGFTGTLSIGNSVTSIGNDAFYNCIGFTGTLSIGNSVTSIGSSAFNYCSGFDGVVFNATNCTNTSSSYPPFTGCSGTLTIGANVERIPAYMFKGCSGFTGSLTIPNSVTSIGSGAFYNCIGFTGTLSIGNSVTSIGSDAFNYCSGFTGSLTIPSSVTSIGYSAFDNCSGFDEVVFNATNCVNLSYYHYCPFSNCVGKLTIGDNVERIPSNMFYDCSGFTSMSCLAETPPSVGYNAFYNVNHSIPVTVPCGTMGAYQSASGWSEFTNYQEDCTATTITDEICYGEDYFENGFEIYYPEVGEHEYSITLPSSQVVDSIVNLMLTVYPVYFFAEDTTLCNATSYIWRGNTYTESGIYYDSLQTVHGCDSIFQLSLELFNTPLGEFASMTPTNNYPFTSLPITFSWDAVSGAEYYNLYLWNANDPTPSVPFAGNIYNRSCYVSSLQNHQTYNWYVEAVNTCFSSTSSVRSFSLNIPPSMNVSTNSLAFGEVVLNDSISINMFVSGNALDDAITLQITGEDASMFSSEQGSNWNGLTGGSLTVTFSPTAVQYNYTANLVITTGTLTQTVQLTGSLSDMFVFNTYVTQDVFEMNSTIPIYGTVTDVNNNPMAGAEVEVKVKVMGTTRSLFATTGNDGHFSVDFVPAYSESGYYTVNSGRVGHSSTAVHDDFNIPGMNLVTNGWILWDVVQNETTTGSIVIRNRSQIPLTNIQVAATTLPDGCSFTFQPLSLQGMEEGVLEYSVTGSALTSGNNYEEVRLVATSAEGATMNFSAWYYCAEPRGILYAAPNNITTTMTKGNSKIVDVMLYNNGTGPTGSVYLDLPSVDWLSVVGNDTLPSIAVHDSAYFSLRLSANENTPLVQYTGNIAVNCERGDGLSLPYSITAVSDSTGTLVVDVTDDYTYNGNGQHLAGATVTVKGYFSLQTVAIGLTGSDGTFTVENIPEGYYRMSITAPRHAEYHATIQIEGGQTNTQNIYLQYQAITYSWNVVPTEIEDEYTFELIVEYETNVPVPVVVIDMPQTFPELEEGESYVFNYIITNYGIVDTYDATLYPPTGHPLYDFTPLITEIDTLHAQSSVVIPCTMTRRTRQRSQTVSEALGRGGNREETECPYSALTQTKQYYVCGDRENWFWANVWRNIGGYACETVPYTPTPGAPGGGGGGYGGGGASSSTPQIIIVHNDGCDDDPCLPGVKDDIDNCPNNGGLSPNLPPRNPANK